MATKVLVNGKLETRAGVYSTVKSGIKNPVAAQSYSNILIIDDGIGAGYGGGSGINGIVKNGIDAIYQFDNLSDFRSFVKGGELCKLADSLYNPYQKYSGVSKIYFAQARTTTPANINVNLVNGSFSIQTRDEGLNANGSTLANGLLSTGIAAKLIQTNIPATVATFASTIAQAQTVSLPNILNVVASGINVGDSFTLVIAGVTKTVKATSTLPATVYNTYASILNADSIIAPLLTATVTPSGLVLTSDATNTALSVVASVTPSAPSFIFQLWHGSYKGLDPVNNVPYDNVAVVDAKPVLLLQSPVITLVSDLINWFNNSPDFNAGFILLNNTATGNIVIGDITTYPNYILATGGTENYGSTDFDSVISKINNLDFTHILATQYGVNATGINNTKLFQFVINTSKYDRLLVVAGGYDQSSFNNGVGSSTATAAYYNSDKVIVVHGGMKRSVRNGFGFTVHSQLHKAAVILGRCAGLEPQVPVTLKSLAIDGEVHLMSDDEQILAISKGVMYSYFDYEFSKIVAGLDINSLQKNDYLINDDGTTYNWALKRIEASLNKGLVIAAKIRFFGDDQGQNKNTSSPTEVVVWAKGYLDNLVATDIRDNLLIRYQDVAASINQDNLNLTYKFVGNTEIKDIISTGTIIAE